MRLSSEKFGFSVLLFLILTWGPAGTALAAKSAPSILHTPRECFPTDQHALLKARVEPQQGLETVRLYFRAGQSRNYQFVEMREAGGAFQTVLPIPSPATRHVVYFIEARSASSSMTRTDEFISNVVRDAEECEQRQPGGTYYVGDSPDIVVVGNGSPTSFPAGFEPDGILNVAPPARTVSTAAAASSGGGTGKKTAIAIGAAGAAGVGIGLLATGSDSNPGKDLSPVEPEEPPPDGSLEPVVACFDMPEKAFVGDVNRIDASCSTPRSSLIYDWKLGDNRTREGRVINVVYREPGAYVVQLTVRRITETIPTPADVGVAFGVIVVLPKFVIPAGAGSDLEVGIGDFLTPTISDGVLRFLVGYRVGVGNRGPFPASGVTLVTNLTTSVPFLNLRVSNGSCSVAGATVRCAVGSLAPAEIFSADITLEMTASSAGTTVTAAVQASGNEPDPNPGNNQASATTLLVPPLKSPDSLSGQTEDFLTTLLEVNAPDGAALGDVQINGQPLFTLTGAGRYEYRFVGSTGTNLLEAHITMPPEVAARWHFDFRRAEHFEAGSIEVSAGQVLSQDAHSIVFQLDGATQSRLTFRFRLEP